jgi:hypothetical protein
MPLPLMACFASPFVKPDCQHYRLPSTNISTLPILTAAMVVALNFPSILLPQLLLVASARNVPKIS